MPISDHVDLTYDPFTLPTAQHRAGLAGLYVVVETMRRRGMTDLPEVGLSDTGELRIRLTRTSLTALFDYVYDAAIEEVHAPKPREKNGLPIPPLREESEVKLDARSGKQTSRTVYIYPKVVPRARFLEALGMPDPWLKLWRDTVWSTLRGIPTTRLPYEQRASGSSVKEADATWSELTRWQVALWKSRTFASEVSGSLYIGAMARNAEGVEFRGSPDHNLLLHFWPCVMGVGEVWRTERVAGEYVENPGGYVIAVPDVLDVDWFSEVFSKRVGQLETDLYRYRPRAAVLALPEEGGLEYLLHLATLAEARARAGEIKYTVAGMEVFHLQKRGNSIRVLATGRVPVSEDLLNDYELVRRNYRDLAFRGQLVRNLLNRRPWYDRFDRLFTRNDRAMFVGRGAGFARDAARRFRIESTGAGNGEGNDD